MFSILKEFLGKFFGSKTVKTPVKQDISYEPGSKSYIVPFLNSELKCSKKEAMAYIIAKTMVYKQKRFGDMILLVEVAETIERLKKEKVPATYMFDAQGCWDAFWDMGGAGFIEIHNKDEMKEKGGTWVIVKPNTVLSKIIKPILTVQ